LPREGLQARGAPEDRQGRHLRRHGARQLQRRLPRLQRYDAVNHYKESARTASSSVGCDVPSLSAGFTPGERLIPGPGQSRASHCGLSNSLYTAAAGATAPAIGLQSTATPAPTSAALLAFFDQASFKEDGRNLQAFLQEITSNPVIAGGSLAFTDLVLESVPSWVSTVPSGMTAYDVSFTVLQNTTPTERHD